MRVVCAADPGELSGPQYVPRIREEGGNFDRARSHVHLAVRKGKGPFVGVGAPVRKDHLEGHPLRASLAVLHVLHVFLLAHGDVNLDGVDGRDGGQLLYGAGTDEVAQLRPGDTGYAVDG